MKWCRWTIVKIVRWFSSQWSGWCWCVFSAQGWLWDPDRPKCDGLHRVSSITSEPLWTRRMDAESAWYTWLSHGEFCFFVKMDDFLDLKWSMDPFWGICEASKATKNYRWMVHDGSEPLLLAFTLDLARAMAWKRSEIGEEKWERLGSCRILEVRHSVLATTVYELQVSFLVPGRFRQHFCAAKPAFLWKFRVSFCFEPRSDSSLVVVQNKFPLVK